MTVLIFNSLDPGLRNAAYWVREQHKIPSGAESKHCFEKEFNCKVHMNYADFDHYCKLEFDNEADAIMFSLKWL